MLKVHIIIESFELIVLKREQQSAKQINWIFQIVVKHIQLITDRINVLKP